MKLQKILFSFEGRIGRRTYWLAILAVIVAVQVLTFAPFLLESETAAVLMLALTSQVIWLLSLWPILAVGSKRLHDRNKSGWWLLVFWLLPFALFVGGFSIFLFDDPENRPERRFLDRLDGGSCEPSARAMGHRRARHSAGHQGAEPVRRRSLNF